MNQTSGIYQFTHPGGEDIYLFHLTNQRGTKVHITNLGAITTAFFVQVASGDVNIVLGFDRVADYMSEEYLAAYPFFGAAIGRYANRIANGRFELDGQSYELTRNQPPHQLHGGYTGFDKKVWQVKSYDPAAASIVLTYTSPDGEEGFPGTLTVELSVRLTDDNELIYSFAATSDKPTPVSLTHHDYFNLQPSSRSIADHLVQIDANRWLEQDDTFVATGQSADVADTAFDFRHAKAIGKDADPVKGYDQSFVVNKPSLTAPMASAFSPGNGLKLEVFSTAPVVHFYTGRYIPEIAGQFGPFSGFCFETQPYPNAVNIPHFPSTIIRPGEQFRQTTIYRVSEEVVK